MSERLAEVEFVHGRGCCIGEPYGFCTVHCDWKVIRLLPKNEAAAGYGAQLLALREALERIVAAPNQWELATRIEAAQRILSDTAQAAAGYGAQVARDETMFTKGWSNRALLDTEKEDGG